MMRLLVKAPAQYDIRKLAAEIMAAYPATVCVNEVDDGASRYIAAYYAGEAPKREALDAIVAAHDPTPPIMPPTPEQRLAAVEAALLELMLREV